MAPHAPEQPAPARSRGTVLPVAPEGWPIIGAIALIAAVASVLAFWASAAAGWAVLAAAGAVVAWAVWFFRDFERTTPGGDGVVVSPADGVVVSVGPVAPPAELGLGPERTAGMTRISVFMNVFNVHVNRAPADGRVARVHYRPGRFFNASLDKASEHNERTAIALELPDGRAMVVVQIAGLVARRIVCRVREGQSVRAGERIGLIRFGSRVDLYLPAGVEPTVRVRERVTAGVSVVARMAPAERSGAPGLTREAV